MYPMYQTPPLGAAAAPQFPMYGGQQAQMPQGIANLLPAAPETMLAQMGGLDGLMRLMKMFRQGGMGMQPPGQNAPAWSQRGTGMYLGG